jgi:hypothetical protein
MVQEKGTRKPRTPTNVEFPIGKGGLGGGEEDVPRRLARSPLGAEG